MSSSQHHIKAKNQPMDRCLRLHAAHCPQTNKFMGSLGPHAAQLLLNHDRQAFALAFTILIGTASRMHLHCGTWYLTVGDNSSLVTIASPKRLTHQQVDKRASRPLMIWYDQTPTIPILQSKGDLHLILQTTHRTVHDRRFPCLYGQDRRATTPSLPDNDTKGFLHPIPSS